MQSDDAFYPPFAAPHDLRSVIRLPIYRFAPHLSQALGLVRFWLERRKQRLALARLDDRLLADIGLTRTQACQEAAKPFWRD